MILITVKHTGSITNVPGERLSIIWYTPARTQVNGLS